MIKGYLKVLVLKELENKPSSGYELLSQLESLLGEKPSSGSVYPLLKELQEKGFIDFKEEGRKKNYFLTPSGKKAMKKLMQEKEELMIKHIEYLRVLENLTGEKDAGTMACIFDSIRKNEKSYMKNVRAWFELQKTVFDLVRKRDYEEMQDELFRILKDSSERLKKLMKSSSGLGLHKPKKDTSRPKNPHRSKKV